MNEYPERLADEARRACREFTLFCARTHSNRDFVRDFVTELAEEHPTIQQQTFELVLTMIKHWSKARYDARNQYTVETCREIVAAIPQAFDIVHVPYI